jgi:nucleotide-binding universal stress UspA family protein
MQIKRILAPIDGSEHAENALFYAVDLAEKVGASVTILTVVPEVVADPDWMRDYTLKMKEEGERILSDALEKAKGRQGVSVTTELREGYVAEVILEAANSGDHDIIVIGHRGLGVVRGFLLGSVSRKVVDQANIPVLIVK